MNLLKLAFYPIIPHQSSVGCMGVGMLCDRNDVSKTCIQWQRYELTDVPDTEGEGGLDLGRDVRWDVSLGYGMGCVGEQCKAGSLEFSLAFELE